MRNALPVPGLHAIRTKRGLTQKGCATLCDLSPATVNQLETGRVNANPQTLRKLADGLKVPQHRLLEGGDA